MQDRAELRSDIVHDYGFASRWEEQCTIQASGHMGELLHSGTIWFVFRWGVLTAMAGEGIRHLILQRDMRMSKACIVVILEAPDVRT